jgi:GGDEF domain-containing protein
MGAYDLIRDKLIYFNKTDDDKLFIQYLIIQKCVALLELSQSMIKGGHGALMPPMLREVFEYTIILAGFDGFVSLNDFINHEKNDQFIRKIRNKMESHALKNLKDEKDVFKGFTKVVYALLSEHTHANIDNLMRFSIDRFSNNQEKEIFKEDAEILFNLINAFFLMAVDSLLELDLKAELLNKDEFLTLMNRLKPDKLESNKVYNRILSINAVKSRYVNKIKDYKEDIETFKSQRKLSND